MGYIGPFVITTHFLVCPMQVRNDDLTAISCTDIPVAVLAGLLYAFCSGWHVWHSACWYRTHCRVSACLGSWPPVGCRVAPAAKPTVRCRRLVSFICSFHCCTWITCVTAARLCFWPWVCSSCYLYWFDIIAAFKAVVYYLTQSGSLVVHAWCK